MAGILMREVNSPFTRNENFLTSFEMGNDSHHKPVARLLNSQPGSRERIGSRIFSTNIISDVKSFLKVKDHCTGSSN